MRVALRTDVGAFVTGAIMAGLCSVGAVKHVFWDRPFDWTPDAIVVKTATAGLAFILPFFAAHFFLSRAKLSAVAYYAAAGAGAFLFSFYVSGGQEIIELAKTRGMVSVSLILPALFGAMLGFLYHWRAGYSDEGDDPAALEQKVLAGEDAKSAPGDSYHRGGGVSIRTQIGDDAFVSTEGAEYFAGPLQVRTSIPAVLITGFSAGAAWGLIILLLFATWKLNDSGSGGVLRTALEGWGLPYGAVAGSTLGGGLLLPIPVYIGHMIARARGWTGYFEYAAVGAALPIAAGLLMFFVGVVYTFQFIVPVSLAMVFYRNLAGLEPKSLPEDIHVSDRRTLVGAGHARRKFGRVVGG